MTNTGVVGTFTFLQAVRLGIGNLDLIPSFATR